MSFQWTKYLDLAKELAGKPVKAEGKEAKLRSAISRAYYAAFHKAREYLITVDGPLPYSVNEHEYVKNWFLEQHDRLRLQIGNNLDRLRLDRNRADYTDDWRGGINGLDKTASSAIATAEQTIDNLVRLTGK